MPDPLGTLAGSTARETSSLPDRAGGVRTLADGVEGLPEARRLGTGREWVGEVSANAALSAR